MIKAIRYVPTGARMTEAMLNLAAVGPGDTVFDLGSGDGRLVIAAALRGALGVGIELDPELVQRSRLRAAEAGVTESTTFIQASMYDADVRRATVVLLYLRDSVNLSLRAKLQRELAPGCRLVSHNFGMGDWMPNASALLEGQFLHLWVMPGPALSGGGTVSEPSATGTGRAPSGAG